MDRVQAVGESTQQRGQRAAQPGLLPHIGTAPAHAESLHDELEVVVQESLRLAGHVECCVDVAKRPLAVTFVVIVVAAALVEAQGDAGALGTAEPNARVL